MLYAIRLVLSNLFGQEDAFIEIQAQTETYQ